tara:strand:- start:547 stop:1680 length:1134 start_codon:yes stop_codon:yes gene_type:complete
LSQVFLENLNKVFTSKIGEDVRAVNDFNLHLQDGEILALLGSSGCGKTTTLRMIAGFETATSGIIKIGDKVVNDLKPANRNVAMAFEGYALYPPLTVQDNIAFSLMREKISKDEVDSKVTEVSELLEITDILDRYPPSISGGQQQRVSLARALVRDSDALLLDEPMSQLEPQLRAVLRARVKDFIQHNKKTVIFVTHDQTEAVALADKIAVMENGDLMQLASPYDISAKPSNVFVASFIGEPPMNILNAKVIKNEKMLNFEILNDSNNKTFSINLDIEDISPNSLNKISNGQTIILGIRPHKIFFNKDNSNFEGKAESSSYHWLGDQIHIGFEINGSSIIGVADRNFHPSSDVKLKFPAESINIFDSQTEKVILNGL